MLLKIKQFISKIIWYYENDPVKKCNLYKNNGCSHVDGILCDFPKCSINKEYNYDNIEKMNVEIVEE